MRVKKYNNSALTLKVILGIQCGSWYKKLSISVCLAMLVSSSMGYAWLQEDQSNVTSAYECTQVAIEDIDSALLTKKERIALLDDSLIESIDSYSSCVSSAAQNMSGGGSGQSEGGSSGNGQSGSQSNSGDQNVDKLENVIGEQTALQQEQSELPQEMPETAQTPIKGNGSTSAPRGIIPPKNNDKIICKLLFQEITKTQDPDMLKGLKQQYTNYKCG